MRELELTTSFKKDYKRENKTWGLNLQTWLKPIIQALLSDVPLMVKHRDHALTGNWADFRECHVKPDLILIYAKPDSSTLRLVRLGSHSELSL